MTSFEYLQTKLYNLFTGRWYQVYISAYGSVFQTEGGLCTLKGARYMADSCERIGNSFGEIAEIRNVYTGKIVPIYPRPLTRRDVVWQIKRPFRFILRTLSNWLG